MGILKNIFNKKPTPPTATPPKNKKIIAHYHIEPQTILKPYKDLETSFISGEAVTNALFNLGIEAELLKINASCTLNRYDFHIINPLDINKLERIKKPLQAVLKSKIFFTLGEFKSDFSLYMEASPRQPVPFSFCNPQGDKTLSPVIGINTNNEKIIIDFNKCPHVLIAGSTGSGKSCLLNTLISSLLLNNEPYKFRLRLFDPKRVEFSAYSALSAPKPYLREPQAKIINDVNESIQELATICQEIESRYNIFELNQVKNIDEYNKLIAQPLPHEFIIIDELADLMLVSRYEVESYLVRIAQIGRACGYHLILATQRPTVNVITGLIKANITTRIALQVVSVRDSVTILDHKGAEQLLGQGDAIIKYPYQVEEVRFQTAYISDSEIKRLVEWWANFDDYEEQDI